MLINRQRLQGGEFEIGTVTQESYVWNKQFDVNRPSFIDCHIRKDIVEDEIKIAAFNSGFPGELSYYKMEEGPIESSAWTHYTPEKLKYRFLGVQVFMASDREVTERQTYGLGEMLGEVGGLFKALDVFFTLFIGLFTPVRLYATMSAALYRDDANEKSMIKQHLSLKRKNSTKIPENNGSSALKIPNLIDI
jgi:hypothetical protein